MVSRPGNGHRCHGLVLGLDLRRFQILLSQLLLFAGSGLFAGLLQRCQYLFHNITISMSFHKKYSGAYHFPRHSLTLKWKIASMKLQFHLQLWINHGLQAGHDQWPNGHAI